jgi:hypothetical protein
MGFLEDLCIQYALNRKGPPEPIGVGLPWTDDDLEQRERFRACMQLAGRARDHIRELRDAGKPIDDRAKWTSQQAWGLVRSMLQAWRPTERRKQPTKGKSDGG